MDRSDSHRSRFSPRGHILADPVTAERTADGVSRFPALAYVLTGSSSYIGFLLPYLAVASLVVSLVARLIYRGGYYPGWDVLGSTYGQYLVSTQPLWRSIRDLFYSVHLFSWWSNANSLLYTLIPGYLGYVWPWEYWAHLLTFVLTLALLWLIVKIVDLPLSESWVLLLAFGASPALLSFSVGGYPYITGFLPHALAIWITLAPRLRQSWALTLALSLLADELSWHLYPAGKSVFAVFFIAAILHRGVRLPVRIVWLLAGIMQLTAVLMLPGAGVMHDYYVVRAGQLDVQSLLTAMVTLARTVFVTQTLDIPVLLVLGLASLFFLQQNRRFIGILLIVQIGLVYGLALKGEDMLRPRRFLMVDCYCLLAIAGMFRQCAADGRFGRVVRHAFVGALILGNIWQLGDLARYVRIPVHQRSYPLPYTYSQADYFVSSDAVEWSRDIRARVLSGEKVFLIYNLASHPENSTDPVGLIERLYLSLGHDRFVSSVYVFGNERCRRYVCLPIRPISELAAVLDGVRANGRILPETVTVYWYQDTGWEYRHANIFESAEVFEELRRRFIVWRDTPKKAGMMRLKIAEKSARGATDQAFVTANLQGTYHVNAQADGSKLFPWKGFPIDITWVRPEDSVDGRYLVSRPWGAEFVLKLSGTINVLETGLYYFLLGADGQAQLRLDGQPIMENREPLQFQTDIRPLVLKEGRHPIEVIFADLECHGGRLPRLILDISRDDRSVMTQG